MAPEGGGLPGLGFGSGAENGSGCCVIGRSERKSNENQTEVENVLLE
jgi:hypothetical protein